MGWGVLNQKQSNSTVLNVCFGLERALDRFVVGPSFDEAVVIVRK